MNRTKELKRQAIDFPMDSVRSYIVEYRDDKNNYYNIALQAVVPKGFGIGDITKGLIEHYESKGYTVYLILAILNGYTAVELEEMLESDPDEAAKHFHAIYSDFRKERNDSR